MSQSRAERRAYEKFLKKVDPIKYADWKSKNIERAAEAKKTMDQVVYDQAQASVQKNG
jgi:hypothetical protein